MGNIYRIRLLELAMHLNEMKQDELLPSSIAIGFKSKDGTGHETFYPDFANAMPMNIVFPKEWTINKDNVMVLKNKPNSLPFESFCHFFNLDALEYMHLFVSYFQDLEKYSGHVILHEHVRPCDIAFNINELADINI